MTSEQENAVLYHFKLMYDLLKQILEELKKLNVEEYEIEID